MDKSELRSRVVEFREKRMWMQGQLAEEARVSPTAVSGIESGRISRPHFGAVKKLARASGVDMGVALRYREPGAPVTALARMAMYSREEEFEESLEGSRSAVSCTSPGSSARSTSVCGGSTVVREASSSGG